MSLTKRTITDSIQTLKIKEHYVLQVREAHQILENDAVIANDFSRYVLNPDHDVSTITDPVVLAQFNAVMTKKVKDNYAKFLKEQEKTSE
tara:strand:+ start:1056 stop:1325 length:270 start_codon:yes stop_codon:yes gene_type:complete